MIFFGKELMGTIYSDKIVLINAFRAYLVCCLDEIDVGALHSGAQGVAA